MSGIPEQPLDLEAVRSSYDRVADNYVAMGVGDLRPTPWLRAALAAFAEDVRSLGPVLDVGCGRGTVTAHLHALGVDVLGLDLSPRMIELARRLHPGLSFGVASATDLRPAEASLGGVLGWWSLFNLRRRRPRPGRRTAASTDAAHGAAGATRRAPTALRPGRPRSRPRVLRCRPAVPRSGA